MVVTVLHFFKLQGETKFPLSHGEFLSEKMHSYFCWPRIEIHSQFLALGGGGWKVGWDGGGVNGPSLRKNKLVGRCIERISDIYIYNNLQ